MQNKVLLSGIVTEFGYSHTTKDVKLYRGIIEIPRKSGFIDKVSFQTWQDDIQISEYYVINGKVSTHNKIDENGVSHKETFVKALNIIKTIQSGDNYVELECILVEKDITRTTILSNRAIIDFVVAINDEKYRKSCYPSLIAWGQQTKLIEQAEIGEKLHILGRFQSREYVRGSTGENGVAYEISCIDITKLR